MSSIDVADLWVGTCAFPRPMVEGNGGDGSLKAIGQSTSRAKPLPGTADGQRQLPCIMSSDSDIEGAKIPLASTYSCPCVDAPLAERPSRKLPVGKVQQGRQNSLRDFGCSK